MITALILLKVGIIFVIAFLIALITFSNVGLSFFQFLITKMTATTIAPSTRMTIPAGDAMIPAREPNILRAFPNFPTKLTTFPTARTIFPKTSNAGPIEATIKAILTMVSF